ncbi:site-specific integrase [Myxosarcina sp. GI1]|uniref:tyrosine-type recombinase/integrase n=1 Tax=Myxosarcina sp. GI1 TaxID=1541065 RepID=UPI00056B47C9|nr:site-specific integrase [Myxosarcina sp. GI1]
MNQSLKVEYNNSQNPAFFDKDLWDYKNLNLQVYEYNNEKRKLNFSLIQQQWLKELAKKTIKYFSINKKIGTLREYISTFNKLSMFVANEYKTTEAINIDRALIINFCFYLSSIKLSARTRGKHISYLNESFKVWTENKWFYIPPYVIHENDYPKRKKPIPRYIPEDVMSQLNKHLDKLPPPVMRMILVIQECGFRVGELVSLKINCLRQDNTGYWFIEHCNFKMKKEDKKPISHELARVIQEQQEYIKKNFNSDFEYLFCGRKRGSSSDFNPEAKVMTPKNFAVYLKKLAEKQNICDSSGKVWNFQSHQFRHTVGTRMINNGVPQHIIQRYLGHESPKMTSVYAHLHDQTLKKEIAKYHDNRVVNVAGELVKSTTPELDNNLDLHLLKKKVLAQSLPNGSCARSVVLGECPHANACLTCGDFRTTLEFLDQHKAQLEETEKLVKNAKEKGWKRHAEMNTKVRDNLHKIISTLESGDKDIVTGGNE